MADILAHAYSVLVEEEEEHGCRDLPEEACREVPGNAARLTGSLTLQRIGDRVVDPKTVLTWLLAGLGAPNFAIGLLVPIRESGSLIPQAAMVPVVRRFGLRKQVWVVGALGQAAAAGAMAAAAFLLEGVAATTTVLAGLAVFALFRSISSISSKDILGKTVPKGNRGSVSGIAAAVAGLGALLLGGGITLVEGEGTQLVAVLVGGAGGLWLGAGAVMSQVKEVPSPGDESDPAATISESLGLLREDPPFRRFVMARVLLLVTALSPPFVVASSALDIGGGVAGLGPFVMAAGLAGLVGAPVWGRLADRSSRLVMVTVAGGGAATLAIFLAVRAAANPVGLAPLVYLVLAVLHAGARMGRKTYVVDLAGGDRRTRYVAVANTVTGVILLGTGLLGAIAAQIGVEWALAALALAGAVGAAVAYTLPEVETR